MDDARRLDILKQNYLLRPLMAYLSSYKRNYKNTPNAYCRKGQGIKLKTLVLKYSLARLYDEADGGAFFPTDIDSGELGDADDVNPIFLEVTTGDGDRFNSLVNGSCADRLHLGSLVLADDSSDCTRDSRSA
jgi:hypothetical protein